MTEQEEIQRIREDVNLIKKALLGELGTGQEARGLIATHLQVMDDIYRNGNGLKGRVERLEEYRLKLIGYAAGSSAAVGLAMWFADHYIFKR